MRGRGGELHEPGSTEGGRAAAHPRVVCIHGRVRLLPRHLAREVYDLHLEACHLGGRPAAAATAAAAASCTAAAAGRHLKR